MRAVLSLSLATALASGCSFGVVKAPRSISVDSPPPRCTTSMARPGLDLAAAGVAGIAGLASEDGRAVLLSTGAIVGLIGLIGTKWVNDCRKQVAAHERLELGETGTAAVTADATAAGTAAADTDTDAAADADSDADSAANSDADAAGLEPVPELEATPATHATSGSACQLGGRCPRGLRCDPVRNQCLSSREVGTEDQPCRASGRCDPGLYCELSRRVCLPGNLGLEGGACQSGGRCGRGLECRSGICVREAQRRRFTRSGSTRRGTAPSPPRDAEPPPADRP